MAEPPVKRLTIPDVLDRFKAYHERCPGWGNIHIILEDGNVSDDDIHFCRESAIRDNDDEGWKLCDILLEMTKTQRLKLGELA